jgi:hypothetical protein
MTPAQVRRVSMSVSPRTRTSGASTAPRSPRGRQGGRQEGRRCPVAGRAERITKASKDDLRAYRDEIASHFDELDNAGKRANKHLRRQIGRVLNDKKANLDEVQAAARKYEKVVAPIQKKLTDRGLLAEGQADKAKLIPYAVQHMGAKHDPEKGIVVTRQVKRAGSIPPRHPAVEG